MIFSGCATAPSKEVIKFKEAPPGGKIDLADYGIRKIIIDAGHGGNDPGAIGRSGLREKEVNLDIVRRLSKILTNSGVDTELTRSGDSFISLERRVEIANNYGADLFISIHSNANRSRSLNGFEVYCVSPSVTYDNRKSYSRSRSLPRELDGEYTWASADLKATLWDMIYTSNRADALELAHSVCRRIEHNLDIRVSGTKSAGFFVLKGARMPAILIEVGYISNSQEERLLRDGAYRQALAEAIAEGIVQYAKEYRFAEVAH